MIYLDHAATTPVPKAVADAMYTVLTEQYANPNAQYPFGQEMRRSVEDWRAVIAKAVGCEANQLFYTSCGTEGDNWAIRAACWQNRHVGRHIVTTAVEHHAVLNCCQQLEQEGWEVTTILPDQNGDISAESVLAAVRPDTALVSVMMVNNELGSIYPIADIAKGLKAVNEKTLLHTDAVQGFLKVPFSAKALGADFIAISGHKVGAPKGIGALYIGPRVRNPRPLRPGGGQEMGLRSGTEATAQIAGFAKAVELRLAGYEEKLAHMAQLKQYALEQLLTIDGVVRIGNGDAPHILSVSLVGYPSANVVTELGAQGICISAGSACHRGKLSHVYAAMKLDKKTAAGVLRVSFAPETTREEIDAFVSALRKHKETRFPML